MNIVFLKFKIQLKKYRILLTFLLFLLIMSDSHAENPSAPLQDLVVTFLDVGQGDAIVIRTPTNKTYLIDAGVNEKDYEREGHKGDFDAGAKVIVPFLKSTKTKFIDGLVITHPHLDHYGGALSVMQAFQVKEFIDSGWTTKSPPYFKLLKKVKSDRIKYSVVKENDKLIWDPHLKVEVLGPSIEPYSADPKKENPNNRSLVIKLTYKRIAFLFTADAEAEEEDYLGHKYGAKLESHILKAPHHASKTSCINEFLDAVKPEIAIISCGRRNRFKHPHPAVLERFKDRNIKYFRTDLDGTIQIVCDGKQYTTKTFRITQIINSTP